MRLRILRFTSVFLTSLLLVLSFNLAALAAPPQRDNHKYVAGELLVKFKGEKRFRVVRLPQSKLVHQAVKEFAEDPEVEYAEPNYIAHAFFVPNDPYYSYQWHLKQIGLEPAWEISQGSGITVAIIDTGIAFEDYGWQYKKALDLAETCFVPGYDFVNNDSHPNDDNGHGTHVTGTVAQSTNNNLGVAGVAFKACLMPVKVLDSRGSGTYAAVADGIYWAVDHGAKVINLSLGGNAASETLENAVAYAYNHGVTVIVAAGNNGSKSIAYPAAYDDYVIAVGATRFDKTLAYYSNYGPSLDLVAPGGDLYVDQNGDGHGDGVLQQTFQRNGWRTVWGYYFFQGTSMAAPHVSGVAAQVLANGNATTPDEIRAALQETAKDLGSKDWDETYGWGLVDAYAALNWTSALPVACSSEAECNDENPCTTDTCVNPGTINARCENTVVADGTVCNDGQWCAVNDVCTAGVCGGAARDCSDEVACTVDSCDEVNDVCVNAPDDSYCNDGLYCNGAEYCNAALGCQPGTPIDCDDGNGCTIDTCNETIDACENTPVADNTPCTDGVCCSGVCTIADACPTEPTMHIGDITFESDVRSWGRWSSYCKVTAMVPILDNFGVGVKETSVYGSWSDAYNRDVSGSTNGEGMVSFKTGWVRGCGTFTFTINDVIKDGWIYNSSANVETSDSITIN